MTEHTQKKTQFAGTYFERDDILRLARLTGIFAWIALGFYLIQAAFLVLVFLLQFARGLFPLGGPTDVFQQLLWMVQPAIPGLWNFVGLQAVGKILLIFMDIEDNTRRAAR